MVGGVEVVVGVEREEEVVVEGGFCKKIKNWKKEEKMRMKRNGRKKRIGIVMKEKKQIVKNRNFKTENKKWKRNLLSEFLFLFFFDNLFFSFFLNVSFLSISVSHGGRIKMEEKQNYFRTRVA
jgi:hypothetical protein